MRFKDKVAIVTGGASGIGKAIAEGFAKEESVTIILDIEEDMMKETAQEIESQGGKVTTIKVDATRGHEIRSAVDQIIRKWGRIDILVNNIGWTESIPFLETDEALWRKILDVNLIAPLHFCRAVLPYMVSQKSGTIVNIGSIAGRQPRVFSAVYAATKAGVQSITRSLAVAMAPYNIRVNCVNPGTIDTPLSRRIRGGLNPEHSASIMKQVALQRRGQTEEVAAAVLFLASNEASYILGQSLNVDGGNNML